MIYDIAIIGGGIAGLSVGFFAKLGGAKCVLLTDSEIMGGASGAAGAFIHPTLGKPSLVKSFTDDAYLRAISFYNKYCDYNQAGAWLGAKDEKTALEFEKLSLYLDANFVRTTTEFDTDGCGAFFVPTAGRISPLYVGSKLSKAFETIIYTKVSSLTKQDDYWLVNNEIGAKNVIFACGASDYAFNEPYLKAAHRGVWGQKAIIKAANTPKHAISIRGVLISEGMDNGLVAIGATHIPSDKPLEITDEISMKLAIKAKQYFDFGEIEIVQNASGMRSASSDYLPLVGAIINAKASLDAYPNMKDGFVPKELVYYDGLFVHYGHGSRAFTTSISTASSLSDLILNKTNLPKEIDIKRTFIRYVRKNI